MLIGSSAFLLAVVLVDAHHGPAAVVFADHAGREVRVEVAGERAEGVGRLQVRVEQHALAGAVALDRFEPLAAGALRPVTVSLDEDDVVALLAENTGGTEPHPTCTNDNELHANDYTTSDE